MVINPPALSLVITPLTTSGGQVHACMRAANGRDHRRLL
jgi:hypothetical protein